MSKRKVSIEVDVVANVARMQGNLQDATKSINKFHNDFRRVAADQKAQSADFAKGFRMVTGEAGLGMIMKFDGMTRQLKAATEQALKLSDAFRDGAISYDEMVDGVVKSLPIFGNAFEAGTNIRKMWNNEDQPLRDAQRFAEETKKLNAQVEAARAETERKNKRAQDAIDKAAAEKKGYTDLVQSNKTPLDNALDKIAKIKEGLERGFLQFPDAMQAQADILAGVIKDGVEEAKAVKLEAENQWKRYDWEKRDHYTQPKQDESTSILKQLLGTTKTTEQIQREQLEQLKSGNGDSIILRLIGG
jgi:hypothetical protein